MSARLRRDANVPAAPPGLSGRAHGDFVGHSDPPHSDDPSSDVTSDPRGLAGGHSESEPVHREWAHLRIIEEIGRGGFGRVYRAWDTTLAREVALKLVAIPELDPEVAAEVLEEGRMLARVRHPNVVTVYGARQIGQEFGLWMELVRGRSLADVVRKDGPFGPEEAAVVTLSVCRALAAVHAKNLVHRDVKAQNVMRESGGRILLMDFGAGWDAGMPDRESWGRTPGTPNYMAPEVIAGHRATPASDIYSVGVLMYFLVTGRHPFEGRTLAEIAMDHGLKRRRLLGDDRPDLPDEFIRVVDRALALDPRERFSTAGALIQELARREFRGTDDLGTTSGPARPAVDLEEPPATPASGSILQLRPAGRRWTWKVVGELGLAAGFVPWLLGLLTSAALNVTLGRPSAFANESVLVWWVWGINVLVPPLIYMSGAVLAALLLRSAWRLMRRVIAPLDRTAAMVEQGTGRFLAQGFEDVNVRGQALVLVEAAAIVCIAWVFWDVVRAQSSLINEAGPAEIRPLAPGNVLQRVAYGWSVDALILVGGILWFGLIQARRRRGLLPLDATAAAGVAGLVLAFLLMWALPYRVTWHNEFQRVQYNGDRCYAIGRRAEELLLHCPEISPPHNRVVSRSDPGLRHEDVIESIFTPGEPRR